MFDLIWCFLVRSLPEVVKNVHGVQSRNFITFVINTFPLRWPFHISFFLSYSLPPPHSGLKIRKMCKNSSFHRNSTNSTLFKSWWPQLYLTKIPNYGFSQFFTFLENLNLPLSRKYKMSSTFFHFREKFLLKNVPLKQNNNFSKSFATEKHCVPIKN